MPEEEKNGNWDIGHNERKKKVASFTVRKCVRTVVYYRPVDVFVTMCCRFILKKTKTTLHVVHGNIRNSKSRWK